MSEHFDKQRRADDALAGFWEQVGLGNAPDPAEFLRQHADLTELLEPRLAAYRKMQSDVGKVAASAVPMSGVRVRYFGDYELAEEIGRGGMGVVYRARQLSLHRDVALKMILGGQLAGEDAVRRFHTEAEAAASLRHPGIVAIHEIGEHEGQHYFSMDYIEGRDLAGHAAGRALAPREAAALVRAVADAIQHAHEQGTLHRDLKPSNVLIDRHGDVRVTDFGLAKRVESGADFTRTGEVLGTPSYMSPEQAAGRSAEVGPASDVYSIGAILYELLTARPPFRAASLVQTLVQVREANPIAPRELSRGVPRALESICLKCLEKAPGRRYASARELADDLQRFLDGEPVRARPPSAVRRFVHWVERHPWLLAFASSAALLGALGLAFGLWSENRLLFWVGAHPDYARVPGALAARSEACWPIAVVVWLAITWAQIDCRRRSLGRHESPVGGGLTWREFNERLRGSETWRKPISGTRLGSYLALAVLGLLLAAGWGLLQIEAYVWERQVSFFSVLLTYVQLASAGRLLLAIQREYRSAHDGVSIDALWGVESERSQRR